MEEEQKRCDTCKHEKEPWSCGCDDCFDYKLWEPKDEEEKDKLRTCNLSLPGSRAVPKLL